MATLQEEGNAPSAAAGSQPSAAAVICNGHHGNPIGSSSRVHPHIAIATGCRSSESSDSSSSESSSEGDCSSEEAILRDAGVTLDLASLTLVDGHAPLELVSQCVSCLLSDQHAAASLLCQKVLELEPGNATAREVVPVLQERLRLDQELPSESSSSSETDSQSDSDSDSSDPLAGGGQGQPPQLPTAHTHCQH